MWACGTNTAFKPAARAGLISDFGLLPIIQVRPSVSERSSNQPGVGVDVLLVHDGGVGEEVAETQSVDFQRLFVRVALREERELVPSREIVERLAHTVNHFNRPAERSPCRWGVGLRTALLLPQSSANASYRHLAVVYGHPTPTAGTWRDVLVWDTKALIQKATHHRDPRGTEAIADYRVVDTFRDASLIEVRLRTGRRNQIRLQSRLRGHTLVGEQRYTCGPDSLRTIAFPRQALHAYRLEIEHPSDRRGTELRSRSTRRFRRPSGEARPLQGAARSIIRPTGVDSQGQPCPASRESACSTARIRRLVTTSVLVGACAAPAAAQAPSQQGSQTAQPATPAQPDKTQDAQQQPPRFRVEANFVRVDVIGPEPPPPIQIDQAMLKRCIEILRTMAENTDGIAVVNSNDLDLGMRRISDDLSSLLLLGYYSTNAKMDGRFRSLKVKVKKPGVEVRARRGYRAATVEEVTSARKAADAPVPEATRAVNGAMERLGRIRPDAGLRINAMTSAGVKPTL